MLFFVLFTGALWGERWTEDDENVLLKEKTNTSKRSKQETDPNNVPFSSM